MNLSNLHPAEGSKHSDSFRRGRGHASGNGKTGRVRRKGKLTDKVRPVLLQRYGLRKYGKRIRERGLQDRQM